MALHNKILHNGSIGTSTGTELRACQLGLLSGWGVFTTLRVAEGALFAWERHWSRLSRDARLLNVALPISADAVESDLLRLVEANGEPNCTMRLVFVRNRGGMWEGPASDTPGTDMIALTADSKQWGESVALGVVHHARFSANEFCGAKVLSWAQNLTWAERAYQQGFDEVVLLNEHGRVAECTSANIFAVFDYEVVTPPLGEGCLPGITREILVGEMGVSERALTLEDLYRAGEVFITSTTRDLLPVRSIEGHPTGIESAIRKEISSRFREYVRVDIERRKPAVVSGL